MFFSDIKDLNLVLGVIKSFGRQNWLAFGLKAGLEYNTLKTIESDNPGSVDACFTECVASWLKRQDNVDVQGKPTLLRLADIVEEAEDRAAADEIRETIKKKDKKEQKSK